MMFKKSQKGFTSVQVSIFISICAIILCIALPIYLKASHVAKYNLCLMNIKTVIYPALKEYYKKSNNIDYPTEPKYKNLANEGFIKGEFPVCPVTKTPYKYIPIWDSTHQHVENFVIYCDSPEAHVFIDKKGYPKFDSNGVVEPEKDHYLDLRPEAETTTKKDKKNSKK